MISARRITRLSALAALCASSPLLAEESYHCKSGEAERTIMVSYSVPGQEVPCEVIYTKEGGTSESLWQAQNEMGYCEEKAKQFIEQLRGWGWDCN